VEWKPVLIGITIMKVMGMKPLMETPLKRDYLMKDAPRVARLLGVPFTHRLLPNVNSLAAQRAFLWLKARDPALAVRFAHRVYAHRWGEGNDITSPAVVAELAAPLGVATVELLEAIGSEEAKDALKQAVDEAIARGVFGVPTFIVDGESIWGSDRLWMLEHWLAHGRWDPA
jgi:2-hydroxychromene-2-carboxylate isomerase